MIRIGHGYDVHKLVEGLTLVLGGEEIPHYKGFIAHSDGDVLVHALMDGLLGALALGDIGKHFPDNDNSYKGISSMILLDRVMELIKSKGYVIGNIDCTILAEKPKLAPYIISMRENVARVTGAELDQISIKATTEEKLGFTGCEEGIAVHCVVLLIKK